MPTVIKGKRVEPTSGAGAGWAAVKVAIAFGAPAAIAALIGMLIMPPRTVREFISRTTCTVLSSFILGPLLTIWVITWQPGLLAQAVQVAAHTGVAEDLHSLMGLFYVMGPCMLIAGLPAWWVLGAWVRWAQRMQEQGIPNWVAEMKGKIFGK